MRLNNACRYGIGMMLVASLLVLGATSRAAAQAQAGTGQIVGTVYDSTGALVPNAKIAVVNKATGLTREATASSEGQYLFPLLPVGTYTLTFTHPGFKTYKVDVAVTVGAALTVNATLTVGEITQVVEVTAIPLVESTAPAPGALIGVRAIDNLPINGRRFQNFVTLTPTVQIEPQRNGISFAGQRGINANVTIDGADYNEPFFGGIRGGERSNNAYTIPQEAISQFQVVSYGYSVEFGRSTGGVLNATTKTGTNSLHGSAFMFARNGVLAANDPFNREAITNLYQTGGSVGGAIKKDKLFYFAAFEDQKNDNPRVVVFHNLDPLRSATVPASEQEAFSFFAAQEAPFTQTNDAITGFGRMDYQLNPSHRLAVDYHYSKNTGENAVSTGDTIGPETSSALTNNGTEGDRTNTVVGQWTAVWSPRLVMETRGQYSLENRPRLANALQGGTGSIIGNTGTRSFLPTTLDDYRVQVSNNATWTFGTHAFKFGGEYNFMHAHQFFKFNQAGIFSVSGSNVDTILRIMSANPSLGFNRFDSTAVTYRVNIGNGLLDLDGKTLAFFGQDTWRISHRVTLTAGFRWEGYFNPKPDVSNTALYNQVKSFPFPIGLTNDPAINPNLFRQFMPRAGLAWDPWGNAKTVIRADAGLFYAMTPLLLYAAPLNNYRVPAGDLSVALPFSESGLPAGTPCLSNPTVYCQMNLIGINLNNFTLDKLPTLTSAQISAIAGAAGLTPNPFSGAAPISMANDFESPRSWQWSAGFEREISRGWSFGMDYLNVKTVHLERDRNLNLPVPRICTGSPLPAGCNSADLSLRPCFGVRGGGACTQSRPIPTLSDVTIRQSNGRSLYKGLTFRSNYRQSRFQFQTYYTLSYNYSDDDNERLASGFDYDNSFNLAPEYYFARLDARHLFAFNTLVELPWGFTLSSLGQLRSGRPVDPGTGSDSNADNNSFGDRAYQAPGVSFKRNSFRDRRVYNVDMRAAKSFHLPREGMRLAFTADFFNVFNFNNITYGNVGGRNTIYGAGVNTAGAIVAPATQFRRLRNPAACVVNSGCYDTNNFPNAAGAVPPFTIQLGVRFSF